MCNRRMGPLTIYRTADAVLNFLNSYKVDNTEAVNSLLQVYQNALSKYEKIDGKSTKKYPLIILEGLDGCGKSSISKRLSSKLHAKKWCTPPESIKHIRYLFDDHADLRTAYYALGNYIAALEVAVVLQHHPVVMDRYWHSTCAFALAQAVNDFPEEVSMPPGGDSFYNWPNDLLKPDIVLLLDVNEPTRIARLSRRTESTNQETLLKESSRFRENILLGYKNMLNPQVTVINGNPSFGVILGDITSKVSHLFKS